LGLFGKSKKSELPPLDAPGGLGQLDIPPPPVPPVDVDPNSFSGFGMPEPPLPSAQGDADIPKPEMSAEEPKFPGLDKDWMNFAKGNTPSIEPGLPKPEAEIKRAEPRPIRPIAPINLVASGPLFMEMETYGEFLGEIGRLHVKLHMMDEMLVRMDSLREKEDFELKRWHQGMDDLRRKLLYMDDALFEPGR
jgi:hypothetical protein